jgi:phosphoribosyl 1,2-cyclic phosphodiesterase
MEMKVTFYGTRGSTPVPEQDFVRVGGNTPCILLTSDNGRVSIFDAGTGIRKLGNDLLARSHEQYDNIFIALSHTHWDHIQGFPFFEPAYDPDRQFTIAIGGRDREARNLEDIFSTQMQREYFPVPLEKMGAKMRFFAPDTPQYTTPITGNKVITLKHNHPGVAYSYRVEGETSVFVYCTDVEHVDGIDRNIVTLARNADLLVHDAQYTPEELKHKRGWGHSSWEQAVEVAEQAGAKRLALFHHDPDHNDSFLFRMEEACQKRFEGAFLAREGMEVEL